MKTAVFLLCMVLSFSVIAQDAPRSAPEKGYLGAAEISGGKFLVATPALSDPNFHQTVVLLIQHDKTGSMGFVINRPSEIKLQDAFSKITAMQGVEGILFRGGPVSPGQAFFLFRGAPDSENGILQVFGDVCVSGNLEAVLARFPVADWNSKVRVVAGYAGWLPQQLQMEVVEGNWNLLDADAAVLFDRAPEHIWPELRRRTTMLRAGLDRNQRKIVESFR